MGYSQVSLNSLWSILFKQSLSGKTILISLTQMIYCLYKDYHSASEEIDVKSCVLSLIDLYNHWLSQPLHMVVLSNILQSIVMLSDLFTVVISCSVLWYFQLFFNDYCRQVSSSGCLKSSLNIMIPTPKRMHKCVL